MSKRIKSLPRMVALELSLVKRGANLKKAYPITKEEGIQMDPDMKELIAAVLENEVEGEEVIAKELSAKGASAAKGILRLITSYKEELPEATLKALAKAAGIEVAPAEKAEFPDVANEEEVSAWAKTLPDGLKEKLAPVVKTNEEEGGAEGGNEMTEEMQAIRKAHDDEIAAVRKELKLETDKREIAEWVGKAEKELSHYPGQSAEELGITLKKLSDADPELAEKQFSNMKAASEALKNSEMLRAKGAGDSGSAGDGAWGKIQKMAEGLVQKSEASMSKAQAIAAVLDTDEGGVLYAEYLDENPKQTL